MVGGGGSACILTNYSVAYEEIHSIESPIFVILCLFFVS